MIQGIRLLVRFETITDEMLGFGECNREFTNEDCHVREAKVVMIV